MRSQKRDRHFLKFFLASRVEEAQCLSENLWLMASGRATREALLSEAGFENVSGTRIGPSEQAVL